jgi:hypothetical protein
MVKFFVFKIEIHLTRENAIPLGYAVSPLEKGELLLA